MLKLKDSRGRESTTLAFVTAGAGALIIKFVVAGLTLGPLGTAPEMDAASFGIALASVLAIWLGREWKQKSLDAQQQGGEA